MTQMRKLTRELKIVNRARKELGLPPLDEFPKARPNASDGCLLSKSFKGRSVSTFGGCQYLGRLSEEEAKKLHRLWRTKRVTDVLFPEGVLLPPLLHNLGDDFDRGQLPELIEEEFRR